MLLSDRVAIITGGAKGIGRATALKFADEGCSVIIADVLEDRGEQTANEVSQKGVKGLAIKCDVTNSQQVHDMVDQVLRQPILWVGWSHRSVFYDVRIYGVAKRTNHSKEGVAGDPQFRPEARSIHSKGHLRG